MTESSLARGRSSPEMLWLALRLAALPLLLAAAFVLALSFGTASIAPSEILQIVAHKLGFYPSHPTWPLADEAIVWDIRLPHIVIAALVGAALGVAGALFQAVLRNPLADPYVIGTSAGAQLGVTLALVLPFGASAAGLGPVQIAAFVGALSTVLFVYSLARTASGTSVVTLVLAGFVVSSFLISATTFLTFLSDRLKDIFNWTLGGIDVGDWSQAAVATPCILLCVLASFLLAPRLDVLLLGEEQAQHLGLHVERLKLTSVVLGALLTAFAVSLAGVIAFVGLIVPHVVRLVYGPGHRILIPGSALVGALFLVITDLVSRVILAPTVVPLGVMTAVVGAPFFLFLLRRARKSYAV